MQNQRTGHRPSDTIEPSHQHKDQAMSVRATATFENISHEQLPYDETAEPTLARANLRRRFQGDLTGESSAELLVCESAPDCVGYVGTDRFVGSLGGRSGSFVFQHGGVIEAGNLRPFGYIVPRSGRGELSGLRGEALISVTAGGEHTLTLNYDFEA
jgi:hypothetical protein